MKRALPVIVAVVVMSALVSGCGAGGLSPADRLKDKTSTMVEAANAGNVEELRASAVDLSTEVQAQEQSGTLSHNKVKVLLRYLAAIERDAQLIGAVATASPTASPSAVATTSPTPSPTRSPTPSPKPSPTPSPTPLVTTPPPTLPPPTLSAATHKSAGPTPG